MVRDAADMKGALKVLVVDDEALIADYLAMLLEDSGHRVVGPAQSCDEALRLLESAAADVALVDIKLKGKASGIDLAHELRRRHRLPFIFITGSGDPTTRQRAEAAQPVAFILKPFKPAQILEAVAQAAGR
jgi:two-component system, response regulator PdtaR